MGPSKDYDWKITGKPFLDGIIFGKGAKKTKSSIYVTISDLPLSISDVILEEFKNSGFQADYKELLNAIERDIDLKIEVIGPSPIFKDLPRFKERRLPLTETLDKNFLLGFFTSISRPVLGKYARLEPDGIHIQFPMPKADLLYFLNLLGIEEYEEYYGNIFLSKEIFNGIQPFDRIFSAFLEESKEFENNYYSREDLIKNKINVIIEQIDEGEKIPEIIGKYRCLSQIINGINDKMFSSSIKVRELENKLRGFRNIVIMVIKDLLLLKHGRRNLNDWIENLSSSEIRAKTINLNNAHLFILLDNYTKQIKQLFEKSKEFKVFVSYLNYLKKRQLGKLDLELTPHQLSQNSHLGNAILAKFFLKHILKSSNNHIFNFTTNDQHKKKKKTFSIPIITERTDDEWKEIIIDNTILFLSELKYFSIQLDKSISESGIHSSFKCESCGDSISIYSGINCEICGKKLCMDCTEKCVSNFMHTISKEIITKYFCRFHYSRLEEWISASAALKKIEAEPNKLCQNDIINLRQRKNKYGEMLDNKLKEYNPIISKQTSRQLSLKNYPSKSDLLKRDSLDLLFPRKKRH